MKTNAGHSPFFSHRWIPGTLALLFLTACASSQAGQQAPAPDEVDIGYGGVERDHMVADVPTVEGDDEQAPRFRTLVEMLSRVPGVRVIEGSNGQISLRVRGATSFQSNEEPLFVLDGMATPMEGVISSLNPNSIQSITVLKDAGDTAIYGSRGANGVILIRTKRAP